MKLNQLTWLPLLAVAGLILSGCQDAANSTGEGSSPVSELTPATMDDHTGHDHSEHAHPSEGPHHGELVELGNEEYHGEVVHNEAAGTVKIYILDGTATKQVAIDATELKINLIHNGKPQQFTLTAQPEEGDEAGKASRFASDSRELIEHLDDESTKPQLVVRINEKSYRGSISHSHEHPKGDHKHE